MKINGKFQPGGILPGPTKQINGDVHSEAVIPLDRLYELITRGDRRRHHLRAFIMIVTESLLNSGMTTAYYCSQPKREIKDRFIKLFTDLQIESGAYMDVDDEIQFNNGSKITFISSASCGPFHIVAPHPVEWVQESKPDSDEANPL